MGERETTLQHVHSPCLSQDLVGSLDLGGGSAEIAFKHTSPDLLGPHHVNVTLRNRTEHLYARSYLCYGHHEAHARFLAHLSHEQVGEGGRSNFFM